MRICDRTDLCWHNECQLALRNLSTPLTGVLAACSCKRVSTAAHLPKYRSKEQAGTSCGFLRLLTMQLCRRATNALEACPWCFSSKRRPKHLTVSIGQTAYLMLPPRCGPLPISSLRTSSQTPAAEARPMMHCSLQSAALFAIQLCWHTRMQTAVCGHLRSVALRLSLHVQRRTAAGSLSAEGAGMIAGPERSWRSSSSSLCGLDRVTPILAACRLVHAGVPCNHASAGDGWCQGTA